jgi:hypothetical protein
MSKRKKEERGRFTAQRKAEAVMRLLKGEYLDTVSRELGSVALPVVETPDLRQGALPSDWTDSMTNLARAMTKTPP